MSTLLSIVHTALRSAPHDALHGYLSAVWIYLYEVYLFSKYKYKYLSNTIQNKTQSAGCGGPNGTIML